jgi:hypothetical protein
VSELSAEERSMFCKEIAASSLTSIYAREESLCAFGANLAAETKEDCEGALAACLEEEPSEDLGKTFSAADFRGFEAECGIPSDCDATVADIAECAGWNQARAVTLYSSFTCGEELEAPKESELPEVCQRVRSLCPGAME